MAKELIISANVHEKKVAILEDGLVTEFYVERRDENQGVVGNLYKGRVMKVLPGMQSAFVDIGLERDAFLYVSDFTEFMEEEDEIDFRETGEERAAAVPRQEERPRRTERARHETAHAPRPAPDRAREEEKETAEANVAFEDIVEQLAEIADERLIPPPPTEEEITGHPTALTEAEPAYVEEFNVERITDEPFQMPAAELAPAATPAPSEEEAEALSEEPAKEDKSRRRSRKKTAAAQPESEKPEAKSRKRPGKAEPKAEEKQSRGGSRKTAPKAAVKKPSRRRSSGDENDAAQKAEEEFHRVTDEDLAIDAGDLLKDAILQEKITEQVHRAEYSTPTFEREPEPEWRVGSFRTQADGSSDFQRVVDETGEGPSGGGAGSGSSDSESAGPADEFDESSVTPFRHISDALPAGLFERAQSEGASEIGEVGGIAGSGEDSPADQGETYEAGDQEDRDAGVRDRNDRAEFAIRRGGRGRRRRPPHPKEAGPATAGDEEQADATPVSEEETGGAEAQASQEQARPEPTRSEPTRAEPVRASDARQGESRPPRHEGSRYDRRPDDRRPDGRRSDAQRRPDQRRPETQMGRRPERVLPPTISELLHEGQEILVQIAKEPIAKKGARITSHIALPGRLLVYMPTVNHVGVSRKIPNDVERVRLKRIVSSLREREGATGGFIARTACAGHTEQELHDDMRYLIRTWSDVRKKAERSKAPVMVHQDLDLVQRILRDQLSEEFTAIRIDNEVEYARIVEFVNRVQPRLVKRVKLYTGNQPIFEKYAVQPEVDKAVRPRVWLKSGGYIVINQTEALVAIDVNTGKFVGKSDKLEDTITRTNLEAVKEIVRQIRLRDLGGIIVLDLIDMEERKNRQRVMAALQQELQSDRAPSKILSINDFGLVAITRKRVKQSLERTLCAPCPYCQGAGMVKSAQTMCFEILEQAKAVSKQSVGSSDVMLRVSPNVAEAFRSGEREVMEEIEAYFGSPVTLEADPNLHQEQYDFAVM
ncbi:MAG TPA: Rne/Rng family ribonuclease [Blastocatellia bacterium]|nr:Rne/Rng family ribonuclease [Blastocatellia bacterium]